MKIFALFLNFSLLAPVWAELSTLSDERLSFWRSQIKKSYSVSDIEAYRFIRGALSASSHHDSEFRPPNSDPPATALFQDVQEILINRPGFVEPIINHLIEKHQAAVDAIRGDLDESSNETYTIRHQSVYALRNARGRETYALKWIPSEEVIRQVGRLYSLPRWTPEEVLELEGPEFGNIFADAIETADIVFDSLIEQDERFKQIRKEHGIGRSRAWQIWFQKIASGEESFRFKHDQKEVNLVHSGNHSSSQTNNPRSHKRNNHVSDHETDTDQTLSPSNWILLSILGTTITGFFIWRVFESRQSKG